MPWQRLCCRKESAWGAKAGGSLIQQYKTEKKLASAPVELELDTEVDSARVKDFVDTQCQGMTAEPQDAAISRVDGKFIITDSVAGRTVDVAATEAEGTSPGNSSD